MSANVHTLPQFTDVIQMLLNFSGMVEDISFLHYQVFKLCYVNNSV